MVVVGDNKQLPPTSFFDRIVTDEEDADPDEAISLLAQPPRPPISKAYLSAVRSARTE